MGVLRHNDVSPQVEFPASSCIIESPDEPKPCTILAQHGQAPMARERQFVGLTRLVACGASLAYLAVHVSHDPYDSGLRGLRQRLNRTASQHGQTSLPMPPAARRVAGTTLGGMGKRSLPVS